MKYKTILSTMTYGRLFIIGWVSFVLLAANYVADISASPSDRLLIEKPETTTTANFTEECQPSVPFLMNTNDGEKIPEEGKISISEQADLRDDYVQATMRRDKCNEWKLRSAEDCFISGRWFKHGEQAVTGNRCDYCICDHSKLKCFNTDCQGGSNCEGIMEDKNDCCNKHCPLATDALKQTTTEQHTVAPENVFSVRRAGKRANQFSSDDNSNDKSVTKNDTLTVIMQRVNVTTAKEADTEEIITTTTFPTGPFYYFDDMMKGKLVLVTDEPSTTGNLKGNSVMVTEETSTTGNYVKPETENKVASNIVQQLMQGSIVSSNDEDAAADNNNDVTGKDIVTAVDDNFGLVEPSLEEPKALPLSVASVEAVAVINANVDADKMVLKSQPTASLAGIADFTTTTTAATKSEVSVMQNADYNDNGDFTNSSIVKSNSTSPTPQPSNESMSAKKNTTAELNQIQSDNTITSPAADRQSVSDYNQRPNGLNNNNNNNNRLVHHVAKTRIGGAYNEILNSYSDKTPPTYNFHQSYIIQSVQVQHGAKWYPIDTGDKQVDELLLKNKGSTLLYRIILKDPRKGSTTILMIPSNGHMGYGSKAVMESVMRIYNENLLGLPPKQTTSSSSKPGWLLGSGLFMASPTTIRAGPDLFLNARIDPINAAELPSGDSTTRAPNPAAPNSDKYDIDNVDFIYRLHGSATMPEFFKTGIFIEPPYYIRDQPPPSRDDDVQQSAEASDKSNNNDDDIVKGNAIYYDLCASDGGEKNLNCFRTNHQDVGTTQSSSDKATTNRTLEKNGKSSASDGQGDNDDNKKASGNEVIGFHDEKSDANYTAVPDDKNNNNNNNNNVTLNELAESVAEEEEEEDVRIRDGKNREPKEIFEATPTGYRVNELYVVKTATNDSINGTLETSPPKPDNETSPPKPDNETSPPIVTNQLPVLEKVYDETSDVGHTYDATNNQVIAFETELNNEILVDSTTTDSNDIQQTTATTFVEAGKLSTEHPPLDVVNIILKNISTDVAADRNLKFDQPIEQLRETTTTTETVNDQKKKKRQVDKNNGKKNSIRRSRNNDEAASSGRAYDPAMPYPEAYPEEYQTIQNGPSLIITKTTYTRIPDVTYTTVTTTTLPTFQQIREAEQAYANFNEGGEAAAAKSGGNYEQTTELSFEKADKRVEEKSADTIIAGLEKKDSSDTVKSDEELNVLLNVTTANVDRPEQVDGGGGGGNNNRKVRIDTKSDWQNGENNRDANDSRDQITSEHNDGQSADVPEISRQVKENNAADKSQLTTDGHREIQDFEEGDLKLINNFLNKNLRLL